MVNVTDSGKQTFMYTCQVNKGEIREICGFHSSLAATDLCTKSMPTDPHGLCRSTGDGYPLLLLVATNT